MRNFAVAVLSALTILAAATWITLGGVPAVPARGNAAANAMLLREAAVVCGSGGCYTPQTKYQPKRKFVPLGHG